jgi:hypothetical protein
MDKKITLSDVLCNAVDKDYSILQAATDLGELMTELELIKRRYGTDLPRIAELERIIPIQEVLALGKLRGDQLFAQLDQLGVKLRKHE